MTPFESVNHFVDRAAALAEIPDSLLARIRMPDSELRVEVTIRRDSGEIETFVGYRVQHNGPAARTRAGSATTPRRHRRGARARVADDLEDRGDRCAVRRRQGRRAGRRTSLSDDENSNA
jgi:hypothetical protein